MVVRILKMVEERGRYILFAYNFNAGISEKKVFICT